ncbi:MAG: glutathione S-transferase [Xenococcaceae cyanobacterium MO_167.B27]|nr:glutathione S-transferase [Xenococcaceae cyanobacterium MO_167.B27]
MGKPKLIIGNKNYSSWSLRAWLILSKLGIEFEEVPILLFTEGYKEELLRYSPAGKVPIYIEDELVVWDTLAIAEYLAEKYPKLWSSNVKQRAEARSISAEMHSGFFALRGSMPMNCRAKGREVMLTAELRDDIQRIKDIWTKCRNENAEAGSWLFGSFTIAEGATRNSCFLKSAIASLLVFDPQRSPQVALITSKQEKNGSFKR